MNPEFKPSRRQILQYAGAAIALVYLKPLEVFANPPEQLTFEDARDVAYQFDRLRDRLPALDIPINQETLDAWIEEVVPWFEAIGIVEKAVKPSKPLFATFADAEFALNVIGRSTCGNSLEMNARLLDNSLSSWSDHRMFFGAAVHELAHAQQGDLCFSLGRYDKNGLESSAQIGMIGVLSAMTTNGNVIALHSFIEEMWSMSVGSAFYVALRDDRPDDFKAFAERVYTTPIQRAGHERDMNFWAGRERELEQSLNRYSYMPLNALIMAHRNTNDQIIGLLFPNIDIVLPDFGYLMHGDNLKQITYEQIYGST